MGIADRKIRQKEEVRTSILKAAWKVVDNEGWQALSIRKIADEIEYSAPVIYSHFENKEAILMEFTKRGFRLMTNELKKARDLHKDPALQLEEIAYAYWDFAFSHKEYYQLMYGVGMPGCEMVKSIDELQEFSDLLLSVITSLAKHYKNLEIDPYLKLKTLWSVLHGAVSINMMGGEDKKDELNRLILKDFIKGFISGIRK